MKNTPVKDSSSFLSVSGEMAQLTREKDWSKTPAGAMDHWPQSLHTLVDIVLNSKFPMFLWWGPELVCFYNDAYRPSLGINGKHPSILGMRGEEAWTEIWPIIKPLIDQVMGGGGATWSEDQLIPIYRNGKIEDVYWTFSYSPVKDDDGNIAGVLVICSETTGKILIQKQLQESERKLRTMILQAPVSIAIFRGPDHITEMVNSKALQLLGRTEEEVLNKPIMEATPELKQQGIKELMDDVYKRGNIFSASELPVKIIRQGILETAFVNFSYEPLYNSAGDIDGIMAVGTEVTEQVSAHKKIEANEEKLNIVLQASGLGTFELDLQKDIVDCSENLFAIFGYGPGETLSHAELLNQLLPEDLIIRNNAFKQALLTGSVEYQSRISLRDGAIRWIEAKGKIFNDIEGKPKMLLGTCRDITEEKNYHKELEEREQKFRLLADSMPQHIWTADIQGNLNYFNQSVFDYSGLSQEEINRDGWIQIVHPDDREENIKVWTEAITTGEDFLFEHRFRRHDGVFRWQLSRAIPQKDEQGNIQMWVGTSTDIQERKDFSDELTKQVKARTHQLFELTESLKKSEERYHLMIEEVQDYAILYLSREGIVENWNEGAEKIKGYRANEIIGKSFSNFYTAADRQNQLPQKLLKMAEQTGRAVQEGWRVKKDGTLFWASVVITAIHNENRQLIGFSKVTHDLTAKKEADDALQAKTIELVHKNIDLAKINKELQSFAYISSHDLQEPLRKIQTFASRINETEKEHLSEQGKDLFRRMQNSAERMQALIDDLLAYSRTHTSEKDFEKKNLSDIIEKVTQDLNEEIQQKNAVVERANAICEVNIIAFQFQQLFYNLISNALKFANPATQLHIKINCNEVTGGTAEYEHLQDNLIYCHISVTDNGIGFDPQYSEKIFELFQRLHGRSEYPGTGIGLAIVKRIVENHNGIITATGEPGKGATFNIYIPA